MNQPISPELQGVLAGLAADFRKHREGMEYWDRRRKFQKVGFWQHLFSTEWLSASRNYVSHYRAASAIAFRYMDLRRKHGLSEGMVVAPASFEDYGDEDD